MPNEPLNSSLLRAIGDMSTTLIGCDAERERLVLKVEYLEKEAVRMEKEMATLRSVVRNVNKTCGSCGDPQ